MNRLFRLFLMAGVIFSTPVVADPFSFEMHELADGVWAAVREDSPQSPVMGNSTVVIGENGVLVFDGGGAAIWSERLIERIAALTDLPVTHVVISHWHGDHAFGIHKFVEAFPNVQIIAHGFTARAMAGPRMNYINNYPGYVSKTLPVLEAQVKTGLDAEGNQVSDVGLEDARKFIAAAEILDREFQRLQVTQPNVIFNDHLEIDLGEQRVQLRYLGDGNTAGDIVLWLEQQKIVATGDLLVHPTPYAFNVPPRKWAATLEAIKALGFSTLVPGHGEIQHDASYLDLNVSAATGIADQRDQLLADGMTQEHAEQALDFSPWEEQFTGGNVYYADRFEGWFSAPFRKSVFKALTGEPMVLIEPEESDN